MPSFEDRTKTYKRLYDNKIASVKLYKKSNGQQFYEVLDSKNRRIGRDIQRGSSRHKALYKLFPAIVPLPIGLSLAKDGKNFKKTGEGNFFRNFKSADWKKYGFKTRKEGEELAKQLKAKDISFVSEADFKLYLERNKTFVESRKKNFFGTSKNWHQD